MSFLDTKGRAIICRHDLRVEVAYYEAKSNTWFVTPDAQGCYWYDTWEELVAQHGELELGAAVYELSDGDCWGDH